MPLWKFLFLQSLWTDKHYKEYSRRDTHKGQHEIKAFYFLLAFRCGMSVHTKWLTTLLIVECMCVCVQERAFLYTAYIIAITN